MKTASIPALRVTPDLRDAAESVLQDGETLSSFVEQSLRANINRRRAQQEFIARGLVSRDQTRKSGNYIPAEKVLLQLEGMLARGKKAKARA